MLAPVKPTKQALLTAAGLLLSAAARAQTPEAAAPAKAAAMSEQELLFWVLLGLLGLLLLVLLLVGITIVVQMKPQLRQLYDLPTVHGTWSGNVLGLLVGDPTLVRGEYRDEILDHNYDGIHEFDNDLPPWWKYGFGFTVAFAFVYVGFYHLTTKGQLQAAEYETEMRRNEQGCLAHFGFVLGYLQLAFRREVVVAHVHEGKHDGEVKAVFPPRRQVIVEIGRAHV